MSQGWRISGMLLCAQALWLAGCVSTEIAGLPRESLVADLMLDAEPRVARMQRADAPTMLPPAQPSAGTPTPIATTAPSGGAKPVSVSTPPRGKTVTVRAWVNGKPIFDEEVMQSIPSGAWRAMAGMPEAQRLERLTEVFNQTLDTIIEQEVIYQEAVRRLEKNPITLEKLKNLADQDFEKQLSKIRSQVPPDQLKELQRSMRKQMERSFISMEYMRSRIFPNLQRLSYEEIKDYYDRNRAEFTRPETVKWQNVFIAVGQRAPSLAAARRLAEDLIATCRTGDDFAKLTAYDDGDAKFRGGEGLGDRRGEIRPVEIENYLFKLRPGEIGPVIPLSTGVHIFRLVARDPGGLQPLDENVQNQIRSKLRGQMADREYRRIVRELRARTVVEVERDG
jgi:parvulin-like peptidyl-prolyl isomerase